jgi:hypothetical protein
MALAMPKAARQKVGDAEGHGEVHGGKGAGLGKAERERDAHENDSCLWKRTLGRAAQNSIWLSQWNR